MENCEYCGATLVPGDEKCPACGSKIISVKGDSTKDDPPRQKRKFINSGDSGFIHPEA